MGECCIQLFFQLIINKLACAIKLNAMQMVKFCSKTINNVTKLNYQERVLE